MQDRKQSIEDSSSAGKWQNWLTSAWRRLSGGCHLNRPIRTMIEDAGFHLDRLETRYMPDYMPGPKPMTFMYEGAARLA